MTNKRSVLVIFEEKLPKKSKKWWRQFEKVIGPKILEENIRASGPSFVNIETLVGSGSVLEAYELIGKISRLTFSDGSRVSKFIDYHGYELWWMNHDNIYKIFCSPYTQYRDLLFYLKDFDKIYLEQPPFPDLFRYFFKVYNLPCIISGKFRAGSLLPVPFGILIQLLLSAGFLLWLRVIRPGLMLRTGDKFASSRDYDFRAKFIYEELRKRQISFVEFVRSLEPWFIVLRHAWRRKRPVVYSTAIVSFIYSLTDLFGKKEARKLSSLSYSADPEQYFWLLVATHYIHNIRGTIWSIRAMKFILRWIGIKAAISDNASGRFFHEILACKLLGIKAVGILHGAGSLHYDLHDFMPGFDGKNTLSVDMYGLWSDWWLKHYLKNSLAYKPEQLYVSGPMRPLEKEIVFKNHSFPIKVLFISEEMADPRQILPYFLTLLKAGEFDLYFKFRPYRDRFEMQLKNNYPEVYGKILKETKILRGTMEEAVSQCDVVVGTYSTAVLEALMQLKPLIFFWTDKWGDNFEMKSLDSQGRFFAETPEDLINCIKKSVDAPKEELEKMRERFFGDPYQNGSKWVVEQAIKLLRKDPKLQENNEIDFLEEMVPDLKRRKILEVGSGQGEFLTAMKLRGYDIVGIEPDSNKTGVSLGAIIASGEEIPFASETFDFVYCNNVLEHCKDPVNVLEESYRVLKPQGLAYFTVINRFAFRDPHYHLNFLNWLPRRLAEKYIVIRGRSKKFPYPIESRIKLKDMHYFTFSGFKKMAAKVGFADIKDLKEYKIKHPELITASKKSSVDLARAIPLVYYFARLFYLSGFRLLISKGMKFPK